MSNQISTLLPIVLLVVAFYLLIMRPQKKRQQALQQTMRSLEPGARVLLSSGVFATVVHVGEKQTVLETSPGAQLTVLKQAIARVVGPEDEDVPVGDEPDAGVGDDRAVGPALGGYTFDAQPGTGSTAVGGPVPPEQTSGSERNDLR